MNRIVIPATIENQKLDNDCLNLRDVKIQIILSVIRTFDDDMLNKVFNIKTEIGDFETKIEATIYFNDEN
jgi:6-pyruvoyl-tetrahydropterin synthase